MTLDELLLRKLSDWRPSDRRQTLQVVPDQGGWTLALAADKADQLGCLVWELTLKRVAEAPAGPSLRERAERIARRVTGLLEPLRLVEVDDSRGEMLLRSQEPACTGDDLHYYEVLLQGQEAATVRRFHAVRQATRREQVAFALTHEALAKLVRDLTADQ